MTFFIKFRAVIIVMKKKAKAAKAKKPAFKYTCMRCERQFLSKKALQVHSKSHLQALYEIKMLERGQVPVETKFGSEFKGKNKVIVS